MTNPYPTADAAPASLPPDDAWILAYAAQIRARTQASQPILELGCGGGRDTVHLAAMGRVVAVDIGRTRLLSCRERVPHTALVRCDLSRRLPFGADRFPVVVASLCLHYFPWATTRRLVAEIRRVLTPEGLLIVRVNSTRDTNYGAVGYPAIGPNFYLVEGNPKRFFDRPSLLTLFADWHIDAIAERPIARYAQRKWVWTLSLRAV
jgi:SAM-dependent methyltransferase